MFDTVSTTAVKMAGATILALWQTDVLGSVAQLSLDFTRHFLGFLVTLFEKPLDVCNRLIEIHTLAAVTDQTIDGGLFGVAPSRMARQTAGIGPLVGRDTEVIERVAGLAVFILFLGRVGQPGPVDGFVKLLFSLGVAGNTGRGDLFAGIKILLQNLVLGVVRCYPVFFRFGGLLGHG